MYKHKSQKKKLQILTCIGFIGKSWEDCIAFNALMFRLELSGIRTWDKYISNICQPYGLKVNRMLSVLPKRV